MNNNLDFLNKTEVNSFVYSSINNDAVDCRNIVIDGRTYTKWGKLQTVTFVGTMFSAKNKDNGKTEYFVTIGMSKQHPMDLCHDRKLATAVARENSLIDPIMIMYNVSPNFSNYAFKEMMNMYYGTLELDMVMTKEEKRKKEQEEFNDEWSFYLNKNNK